jgi:hypothetical protein
VATSVSGTTFDRHGFRDGASLDFYPCQLKTHGINS